MPRATKCCRDGVSEGPRRHFQSGTHVNQRLILALGSNRIKAQSTLKALIINRDCIRHLSCNVTPGIEFPAPFAFGWQIVSEPTFD
eukprot:3936990-Rhodomonas_salina.3